jgi:uncharacterized membrane protein YGL010W
MLGNRTSEQWIAQYSTSHQHPINRLCHTLGIPTILVSLAIAVAGFFFHRLWFVAAALFVLGWILQFVGHAFEGKPPEFFSDWRFLFVGVRWWWAKINGKAYRLPSVGRALDRAVAAVLQSEPGCASLAPYARQVGIAGRIQPPVLAHARDYVLC